MSASVEAAVTGRRGPARFPRGRTVIAGSSFEPAVLARVDEVLAAGDCPEGRLEIATEDVCLVCLVHRRQPYLAGLIEGELFSPVSLAEFPVRARQLEGARWELEACDVALVMMVAVHFCQRPVLQASTRLANLAHVLDVLASDRGDAALAFERDGRRTLLFLHRGRPARLFFGEASDDPGEGDLEERLLLHAFAPEAEEGRFELFTRLAVEPDPEAGTALAALDRAAQPPPPRKLVVRMADGRELFELPFVPPSMVVGRDPAVEVTVDNLAVSRRHAQISWDRGRFEVRDLGSANGTAVNGRQINRVALADGDQIEIGKFTLRLEAVASAPDVADTMMISTRGAATPLFLVGEGQSVPLAGGAVVGRGRGVDVRARGWRVRPVHVRLAPGPGQTLDLVCFGRARVRVNGETVRGGRIARGDRLTVGRSSFWVRAQPGDGRRLGAAD